MSHSASGPPNQKAAKQLLARLEMEIVRVREELALARVDLRDVQTRVGGHQMMQLLEANEHLVLDAMRLRRDAETSAFALETARRSTELDLLTGLPNRSLLIDRCAQAIANARRYASRVAVLFVDLDNFKRHNDCYGHAAGDQVLIAVGQKMASCVREVDTVCRLGGDEFVVLLADVPQRGDQTLVATKLLAAMASIEAAGAPPFGVSASIGISLYPDDGDTLETLLEAADIAMFNAKRRGGGRFSVAGEDLDAVNKIFVPGEIAALDERRGLQGDTHEQLASSATALEPEIETRSSSFEAMERRLHTTDQFLAVLSHELRNPLAPIVSTLDALRLRAGGAETKEHQVIRRHVAHMVRLVDDLLDIAKLSSGSIQLKNELVPIDALLSQAIALAKPVIDQQKHEFICGPCDPAWACRGDFVRLAQCVSNLLINAARYTAEGGRIELTVLLEGEQIAIRIKDNGRGISEAQMAKVFELFYQTQGLGTSPIGGLGVGLALVRSLIEQHGGTVAGFSAGVGHGSEFTLRVPWVQGVTADLARARPPASESAPTKQRILIVDDNQDAVESLAAVLMLVGHEVWTATHPRATLALIAQARPQIVILDIGLPEMDGYRLAREIRRLHPEAAMSFVALSGYGSAADRSRSEAEHFVAHLIKPVDFDELQSLIESLAVRRDAASGRAH